MADQVRAHYMATPQSLPVVKLQAQPNTISPVYNLNYQKSDTLCIHVSHHCVQQGRCRYYIIQNG